MKQGLIRATIVVMILTLLGKALGFIKSLIQASYFGASYETDALNVAEGFVSNIMVLFATAVAVAFVPIYIETKERAKGEEKKFASSTLMFFSLLAVILSIVMFIFAEPIMKVVAPSYEGEILSKTADFFRIFVAGFVFSVGTSIFQQMLNAEKIYGFSAASSLINSTSVILCIIFLQPVLGIWSLVIAWIVSYLVQTVVVAFRGRKYGTYSFRYGIWNQNIKRLLVISIPIWISQGTIEINQIVDKALLTEAEVGAVTAVSYAAVLYGFASQFLKTSFGTVLFTAFAELGARRDYNEIGRLLKQNLLIIAVISSPIIVVFCADARWLTRIVYGHGKYDDVAVGMTSIALSIYILILAADVIKCVISKAFYCLSDTKSPMVIGIAEVCTNITFSIILSRYYGMIGVLFGTVIAEIVFMLVMILWFQKKHASFVDRIFLTEFAKILFSTIALVCTEIVLINCAENESVVGFVIRTMVSCLIYLLVLIVARENNTCIVIKKVRNKLNRRKGDIT